MLFYYRNDDKHQKWPPQTRVEISKGPLEQQIPAQKPEPPPKRDQSEHIPSKSSVEKWEQKRDYEPKGVPIEFHHKESAGNARKKKIRCQELGQVSSLAREG
jgi:hypothetical protein